MFDSNQVRPFDNSEDSEHGSDVEAHTPTRPKSAQSNAGSPSSVAGVNLFDANASNISAPIVFQKNSNFLENETEISEKHARRKERRELFDYLFLAAVLVLTLAKSVEYFQKNNHSSNAPCPWPTNSTDTMSPSMSPITQPGMIREYNDFFPWLTLLLEVVSLVAISATISMKYRNIFVEAEVQYNALAHYQENKYTEDNQHTLAQLYLAMLYRLNDTGFSQNESSIVKSALLYLKEYGKPDFDNESSAIDEYWANNLEAQGKASKMLPHLNVTLLATTLLSILSDLLLRASKPKAIIETTAWVAFFVFTSALFALMRFPKQVEQLIRQPGFIGTELTGKTQALFKRVAQHEKEARQGITLLENNLTAQEITTLSDKLTQATPQEIKKLAKLFEGVHKKVPNDLLVELGKTSSFLSRGISHFQQAAINSAYQDELAKAPTYFTELKAELKNQIESNSNIPSFFLLAQNLDIKQDFEAIKEHLQALREAVGYPNHPLIKESRVLFDKIKQIDKLLLSKSEYNRAEIKLIK